MNDKPNPYAALFHYPWSIPMTLRYHATILPVLVLCASLLIAPAPAAAIDCSAADTLLCGTPSISYKLKQDGVPTTGTICTTSGFDFAIVFVVVIDTMGLNTFTATSTPSGSMDLFLLASCDEFDCVPGTTGGMSGAPLMADCVVPGTYYLIVSSISAANATFDITRTCTQCVVTPVENATWGTIKALYR